MEPLSVDSSDPRPGEAIVGKLYPQMPIAAGQAGTPGGHAEELCRRADEARRHSAALTAQSLRLSDEFARASAPLPLDQLLERSPYARLMARLKTMPVIEQAKGIIMARSHCGEAEAFELLRRASQRGNVPVRELAAHIVASAHRVPAPRGTRGLPPMSYPGHSHASPPAG